MSWLGNSFSSLAGQLNSFTTEVLSEGREEPSDHEAEKSLLQQHVKDLKAFLRSQNQEVEHLQKTNSELDHRTKSAEFQVTALTKDYRTRIQAKEEEIKALRLKNQELKEQVDKLKLSTGSSDEPAAQRALEDLNDIISCQCEINKLHETVRRLQADRDHWKHLSTHAPYLPRSPTDLESTSRHSPENQGRVHPLTDAFADQQLGEKCAAKDDEDGDRQQVRIDELQSQLRFFQEKTEDQNHVIDNLRSQLDKLQSEKSKIDAAFQNIQTENELVKSTITALHDSEQELQRHLSSARDMLQAQSLHVDENSSVLKDKLIAAEGKISELLHDREQVSCDLFAMRHRLLAQLHSSHASNAEMLRDLCLVRQKFNSEVTATQSTLDNQKEKIISAIEETNKEHKDIKSRISELMTDQEITSKESQRIVHSLGAQEQQEFIAGALHALDLENKVIKQTNDDLHKQVLMLQENAKNCKCRKMAQSPVNGVEDFYHLDSTNALETLLAVPVTPSSDAVLTLSECNNTDDHKEHVKQLIGLKESTVVASISEMLVESVSSIKSTDEVEKQQEVEGNAYSLCSSVQVNHEKVFEENKLLTQELEKLREDITFADERLKAATESHEAETSNLTQSVLSLTSVKEELEEKLEAAHQNNKTLQAEIKQIKCDQIQSLWKTEPWVDISEGLENNKENLNMELQDLELDSLSSKCSKEGKSDDSMTKNEKKDHGDRKCELKKNDSFVNIDSSEIKTSDDGSERISFEKTSSDSSLEVQVVHKEAQTETNMEMAALENLSAILESVYSSVNRDMNVDLQVFKFAVLSFQTLLDRMVEGKLISITEDEPARTCSTSMVISGVDELNHLQQQFPQIKNLKSLVETFRNNTNCLKRLLNELRHQSSVYANVIPKMGRELRKLPEKDRKLEVLEKRAVADEQELRNNRKQIIALNSILRVYKKNLGPEQSTDADRKVDEVQATGKNEDVEKLQHEIGMLQQEKQQMLLVLNEKSQETASLKAEVHRLMNIISSEKTSSPDSSISKHEVVNDIQEMREKTVKNLAQIIKTKDEEIEAMKQKNETLTAILQKSSTDDKRVHSILQDYDNVKGQLDNYQAEREQIIAALTQKHEESVMYHSEIQRLLGTLTGERQTIETLSQELTKKESLLMENQHQLNTVKEQLKHLDAEHSGCRQDGSLCVAIHKDMLQSTFNEQLKNIGPLCGEGLSYFFIPFYEDQLRAYQKQSRVKEFNRLLEDRDKGELDDDMLVTKLQMEDSSCSLFALRNCPQSITDRDRERQLQNEVERLRNHLIEMEEMYTQEAIEMEKREKELRVRILAAEEMNFNSYSSVSKLPEPSLEYENQFCKLREEKTSALLKLDSAENQVQHLTTSIHTLQMVLERFQQEKENEIIKLLKDHEKKLLQEKDSTSRCQQQISQLQQQLDDTAEALEAASRISAKLDSKEELIAALKQEVAARNATIHAMQEEIAKMMNSSDGKIDRSIIKNLVVNYFVVHQTQKTQVLHLMGMLLDFNKEERIKVGLERENKPWIPGWFSRKQGAASQPQASNQSLSAAFVQFLEKESRPIPMMTLPAQAAMKDLPHGRSSKVNLSPGALVGSKNDLMSPHLKTITSALPVFTLAPVSNHKHGASSALKDVL